MDTCEENLIDSSSVTVDTSTIDGALPEDSETIVSSISDKSVEIADNDKSELAISNEELNIKGSQKPDDENLEKNPEQLLTAESSNRRNFEVETSKVEDDDDEELELRWDDDDDLLTDNQNDDATDISAGLKDINADEIGAGDDGREDTKMVKEECGKPDILAENNDTNESCNIDMDTEDKLLEEIDDSIGIDKTPILDPNNPLKGNVKMYDVQLAKDSESFVEEQKSETDIPETINTKEVTIMQVDADNVINDESEINLDINASKPSGDVNIDGNPDNDEIMDISMEMEDNLLKDDEQAENKKLECAVMSIDSIITEKDTTVLVDNKNDSVDVEAAAIENIAVKDTLGEASTIVDSKNLPPTDDSDVKKSNHETAQLTSPKTSIHDISLNDSRLRIKTDHALSKPDAMLEIPTQELIDIDDFDESLDSNQSIDTEQQDRPEIQEDESEKDIVKDQAINMKTVNENVDEALNVVAIDNPNELRKNTNDLDLIAVESKVNEDSAENNKETDVNLPETVPDLTEDVQPSTSAVLSSKMTLDDSAEVPDVSDSLGLLAEASGRVMDDDEEPDDDEADNDDDFDPEDESSNPMTTAEHSEDSNPQHSDSEAPKDQELESPSIENAVGEFQFEIGNLESETPIAEVKEMDVDEVECIEDAAGISLTNEIQLIDDENGDELTAEATEDEANKIEKADGLVDDQVDIETVKLSDTSDNEADVETAEEATTDNKPAKVDNEVVTDKEATSIVASPISPSSQAVAVEDSKQSPSKKKLELSQGTDQPIFNIVDLGDSDEEVKVTKKPVDSPKPVPEDSDVTSVNLPKEIEVMATSAGSTSDIVTKEGEIVISGVPKPTPIKSTGFRLNTGELSIKTSSSISESSIVIPETKMSEGPAKEVSGKPKMGLEIFSLDSDEEDNVTLVAQSSLLKEKTPAPKPKSPEPQKPPPPKCVNTNCKSGAHAPKMIADATVAGFYGAVRKRRSMVCVACAEAVDKKAKDLINGMKDFVPLLELCADKVSEDLVEISDSEDEEEKVPESPPPPAEKIGDKAAILLEENLARMLNATWLEYKMDDRLVDAQLALDEEFNKLDKESKEIDQMLNECQVATDRLRNELYAAFEQEKLEEPPIVIFDTPTQVFTGPETTAEDKRQPMPCTIYASDSPPKRVAMPLKNTTQVETPQIQEGIRPVSTLDSFKTEPIDDDKDVSVVKLSAESAPSWLPPVGELTRAPLRVGMSVVAIMRNTFGRWLQAKIVELMPRSNTQFTSCRVKFEHKVKNPCRIVSGRGLAYINPPNARLTIGTRIIALFKDENTGKRESYYSGVVSEIPNPVNSYRYLVFFDDGYAQYVDHNHTRLVCETSSLVWEEVHPFSREFVREYLMAYPERPMVRLHEGQSLRTEWNGKWWNCKVLRVDASLAQILFLEEGRREWIYRGSTRLAPLFLELKAAERHRQRPMPRSKAQTRTNMPYVEYTRSEEQSNKQQDTQQQQTEDMRRQRAVAKKSTVPVPLPAASAPSAAPQQQNLDTITSRVVYYTPKNAVRPYKMSPHTCGPKCKRTDVLSLKDLRTYNPLAKPLLSGWERQIVRFKGHKEVMYRAPCGRRVRSLRELHHYLRLTNSELPVDLFDFYPGTHCLAEFVLNKCLVGKKDLSHGKENVPVPCVNYYDESLPEFCSYNTERTPTAGVPLNLDPEFLCGCDCTDDCQDKTKCACWKMTLEGARTIGLEGEDIGYEYRRLPEPLPSGIYECNSRCKCKNTCLNRVAQHPLQLKLQVFKTLNRGWGIRALNDVPKGAFLCVYAGNLLTDATANLDGLNEGDEYLAELDYIEVVEQMKEGYEEDIPEADKRLDKRELAKNKQAAEEEEEEELPSSDDEDTASKNEREDDDFHPGYIGLGVMEFSKRLRRREKAAKEEEEKKEERKKDKDKEGDDCITISDDEEVREPSRFMVQTGMGGNEFISKYKSVRALFGQDEACYIMDAKVQGNIGRYLNHSCTPNVFVQNVFVDTHDPRFPWVAFFALSHIKAGTELTWNYNYDVGSVPGKVLYCYCGAPNCRGRLL